MILAAAALGYLLIGLVVHRRRSDSAGDRYRSCPACGFQYAFDGRTCGHCGRRVLTPLEGGMRILAWPLALLVRVRANRTAEPLNSHPGRVIPDGVPARHPLPEIPEKPREEGAMSMGAALRHVFDSLPCPEDPRVPQFGLSTGFHGLDDLLHGLQPGRLYVVAGAPSTGKTSLVLALIEQVALRADRPVLFYSPEAPASAFALQAICTRAKVDANRVRDGRLTEEEYQNLTMAAGGYHESRILVDDSPRPTLDDLRERTRRMKAEAGIALVVLDAVHAVDRGRTEIALVVSTLRSIARELDVPVVAVAHTGRVPESREGGRPGLSDFGEPDAFERVADVIALLHREPEDGVCEVIVAKNRTGPTGVVRLAFKPEFMRMENLAR